MRICHLSPHMGGGVGSVIKSFIEHSRQFNVINTLWCLDHCRSNFVELNSIDFKKDGISFDHDFTGQLSVNLSHCDVLLVHYWNHPLMSKFLAAIDLPARKTIFWIHNSGLHEPHIIPEYLVKISRQILFSSACSYHAPNLKNIIESSPHKFGCVHSTRSLSEFLRIGASRRYETNIKNLLYIGTVSDAKMHPQAAEIFATLSQQGYSILVVGGPNHESLAARVHLLGGTIEITGEVKDVKPFLEAADLFIYPLRLDHYGTGEQVMLEALASGLPIVAFNNPAERVVLAHGGGALASNTEEFLECIFNYRSNLKRYRLESRSAIDAASEFFDLDLMTKQLLSTIKSELDLNSCILCAGSPSNKNLDPLKLYALHSLFDGEQIIEEILQNPDNDAADIIFNKIKPHLMNGSDRSKWTEKSKSTPKHYLNYFPWSKPLLRLSRKIDEHFLSSQ